jgi:putative ABC transport system substrate-binding protein
LLRELVPGAIRVAVLINPGNAVNAETTLRDAQAAARAVGLQMQIIRASTSREIDAAFATMARERPDALLVGGDPFFNSRRIQLALLTARHAVSAIYASREYVEAGGLMSYGPNFLDAYRQVGGYVGRILKGAKPTDLPVVQSSKFELVINAQTARVLGLTVAPTLIARAAEVIEVRSNVRFSNRPVGVNRFQPIHQCSVDVARGLALLFGIGTKALPSWDSRTR